MTAPTWWLGEFEPARRATTERRGESLVRGRVKVVYVGREGELLGEAARECFFPFQRDRVRTSVESGKIVATFPAHVSIDGEPVEGQVEVFRANADEWTRASASDRKTAIAAAGIVPSLVLLSLLEPLPEPKPAGGRSRRRIIDYGDGMTAIITEGEARQIEFADGESVIVTDLPEGSDVPRERRPRYLVPQTFRLEILDEAGMRVGPGGKRYRPCDTMPEWN